MYFDRFDVVEAHYCFCADYHAGQGSALYARLSRILGYLHPRPNLCFDTLTENGKAIYRNLVMHLIGEESQQDYGTTSV